VEEEISFSSKDKPQDVGSPNDPMVIKMDIANFIVHKVLVDSVSSADVIDKMGLGNAKLEPVRTPLVGFGGSEVASLGMIELPVSIGVEPRRRTLMVKFLVVDTPFTYNVILGRPGLNSFQAVVSTYHMKMKCPTENGVGEVSCDKKEARKCYNLTVKRGSEGKKRKAEESPESRPYEADHMKPNEEYKLVELVEGDPSRTTRIGSCMGGLETSMIELLRENVDMFAWSPLHFRGGEQTAEVRVCIRDLIHRWALECCSRSKSIGKMVYVHGFYGYNEACPKDPYPLSRIYIMVDSTAGYEIFSMMDAYQGYHQIHMAKEVRDKTSSISDGGIYCYNVIPFSLKNAGADYQ
ncbi:UNVERIFIED_CONTAM: hypothetical protein Sindi_0474900, partial [Sesamum indicum]